MIDEDLRLVFEPAESAAVDDAVPVALEGRAQRMLRLGVPTPQRLRGPARIGGEQVTLPFKVLRAGSQRSLPRAAAISAASVSAAARGSAAAVTGRPTTR